MFNKLFWKATTERAIKTFIQTFGAVIVIGTPFLDIDWTAGLGLGLTALAASVVTSVGSAKLGEEGTPSLVSSDSGEVL